MNWLCVVYVCVWGSMQILGVVSRWSAQHRGGPVRTVNQIISFIKLKLNTADEKGILGCMCLCIDMRSSSTDQMVINSYYLQTNIFKYKCISISTPVAHCSWLPSRSWVYSCTRDFWNMLTSVFSRWWAGCVQKKMCAMRSCLEFTQVVLL